MGEFNLEKKRVKGDLTTVLQRKQSQILLRGHRERVSPKGQKIKYEKL